ncbi:MAG: hypothetical protein JWQ49_4582 [Edaphobacter sp.]|nr:hypothetical protein [Edaphobacter sp.]
MPQVGDKVRPDQSVMVYEISKVHYGGDEVDLHVPGTNLTRFRMPLDRITFVERKPPARTSNPFTDPESVIDAGEVLERIRSVERDNVQRLKDDMAILTKYLMTQGAPKAVIGALEGLSREQHESWKKAVEHIEELLEE